MRSIGSFFIFLVILLLAVAVLLSYFSSSNDYNPVTGKAQKLFMDITEETLLGGIMQETVITREGGLCPDPKAAAVVLSAGRKLSGVGFLKKSPWNFSFYLLSDSTSAALYANPDGSVLITKALYDRLVTEDQLAALLAHGIGHIVARHTTVYLDREKSKGTIDIPGLRDLVEKAGKESLTPEFEEVLCDRPYTAVEEIEADQTAATILKESGYEPGALTEVLKMMRENRTDERLSNLLEIHPLHSQRMEVAFP